MQALLVATALVLMSVFAWRVLSRRAARRTPPRIGLRVDPALSTRTLSQLSSRTPAARRSADRRPRGGVVRLEGLDWATCVVDELPYSLAGVTIAAPRGLYDVPCGKHRLVVGNGARRRSVDFVVEPGDQLRVRMAADDELSVDAPQDSALIDASYIHYPTWSRGPLLGPRAPRPHVDVTALLEELDRALSARGREGVSRLGDRLVGVPLLADDLAMLRHVCQAHVEAAAERTTEMAARVALFLPEPAPLSDEARPSRDRQSA